MAGIGSNNLHSRIWPQADITNIAKGEKVRKGRGGYWVRQLLGGPQLPSAPVLVPLPRLRAPLWPPPGWVAGPGVMGHTMGKAAPQSFSVCDGVQPLLHFVSKLHCKLKWQLFGKGTEKCYDLSTVFKGL